MMKLRKQTPRPRTQRRGRSALSTLALLAGGLMILAGAGRWAAGYPWQLVFHRIGWAEHTPYPEDPAPLPAEWTTSSGMQTPNFPEPAELPGPAARKASQEPPSLTWLGTVKLPVIGVSENIVEGTGDEMLYAVGHLSGSAAIGGEGNCVLAAHRNYVQMNPFRHLDKLRVGDDVFLRNGETLYVYEVVDFLEVEPSEVWVTEPAEGESHLLTLLTCTPVANPTRRLVVRCRLVDWT